MKNRVKNFVLLFVILSAAPALIAARSPEIRFYIRLNEVGYRPDDFKTAVAFGREPLAGVPFVWCSNNLTVALATQGALYERMTGDRRFREFTAKQFDWLLGRNPWASRCSPAFRQTELSRTTCISSRTRC